MDDLRQRATVVALAKMFKPSGYFDICVVDTLRKVWNLAIPAHEYETLRLLHCVHYSEMPSGTREEVLAMVTRYVREAAPDADFSQMFRQEAAPARPTFMQRLIGGAK